MKRVKGYTPIYNYVLLDTRVSASARLLLCILIMHCGLDDNCFPSQNTLATELGYSDRYVRILLNKLIAANLIEKTRNGYNKTNTYWISEKLLVERDRNSSSTPSGKVIPISMGNPIPTKSTHIKVKDKNSSEGIEILRKIMEEKGLLKTSLSRVD